MCVSSNLYLMRRFLDSARDVGVWPPVSQSSNLDSSTSIKPSMCGSFHEDEYTRCQETIPLISTGSTLVLVVITEREYSLWNIAVSFTCNTYLDREPHISASP